MHAEAWRTFNRQDQPENESMGNIEWARWSWNPVTGCKHDCPYCYARDIAERFFEPKFEPAFWPDRLAMPRFTNVPDAANREIAWRNVFSNSMSDLYGRWVPNEWINAVLSVMRNSPQWNFLMLTKFPKKAAEFTYADNCWIGASVDMQVRVRPTEEAFERIECKTKWLSLEPLIEPLKFSRPELFNWVVIGGASKSTQTPEWTPPAAWTIRVAAQFLEHDIPVYLKTNGRPREYPGVVTPQNAGAVFHYLKRI
jgi:protein gp37